MPAGSRIQRFLGDGANVASFRYISAYAEDRLPRGRLPDRRLLVALGLGFSSGMPFLLVYVTPSASLSEAGVPIATIGLLSELPPGSFA